MLNGSEQRLQILTKLFDAESADDKAKQAFFKWLKEHAEKLLADDITLDMLHGLKAELVLAAPAKTSRAKSSKRNKPCAAGEKNVSAAGGKKKAKKRSKVDASKNAASGSAVEKQASGSAVKKQRKTDDSPSISRAKHSPSMTGLIDDYEACMQAPSM